MNLYDMALPVMKWMAMGKTALMAIFTAYIDDVLGFEIFCRNLPVELFEILRDDLRESDELQRALRDTSILKEGSMNYLHKAFEDYDMWYHFLDGTDTILRDPGLVGLLPKADWYVAEGLFRLWQNGKLDEDTWDAALEKLYHQSIKK